MCQIDSMILKMEKLKTDGRSRIQYFSDIHLENYTSPAQFPLDSIPVMADTLILAGDVGHIRADFTREMLKRLATQFSAVLYIPGNHEYFQDLAFESDNKWDMQTLESETAKFCSMYPSLHFLNKATWIHEHTATTIYGCTLWSDIPPTLEGSLGSSMTDFTEIFAAPGKPFTARRNAELFADHFGWLSKALKKESKGIVVTHYVPTFRLCEPIKGNPVRYAIANDLDGFIQENTKSIKTWICGHFHALGEVKIGDTMCLLNAANKFPKGSGIDQAALRRTLEIA